MIVVENRWVSVAEGTPLGCGLVRIELGTQCVGG